jgi:alkylation response protein AidB-like acyl-CoA dehydrogenase
MMKFNFEPTALPADIGDFRQQIRDFLARELVGVRPQDRANCWAVFDADFSRKLGAMGWIGMTWPRKYGGGERSAVERYVLLEELLAAGAPVGAHWIADRQSGPALLRYGTEEQRLRFLPSIARGETYCCIGMSEPGAGSDLASVRTRAERLSDGRWKINGQKIWTTNAHRCQLMIALIRTGESGAGPNQVGLTQFLIELDGPGIEIRPITDLVGGQEFCEVFFQDAIVSADSILGVESEGWKQCTSELSLERSGPERYLSSFALYLEFLRYVGEEPSESEAQLIGCAAADVWCLRQMSLSLAGQLADGKDPYIEAAIVKDLGNSFEQNLPVHVQSLIDQDVNYSTPSALDATLGHLLQSAPSFSLRGGTREILRGIIARGLGLR